MSNEQLERRTLRYMRMETPSWSRFAWPSITIWVTMRGPFEAELPAREGVSEATDMKRACANWTAGGRVTGRHFGIPRVVWVRGRQFLNNSTHDSTIAQDSECTKNNTNARFTAIAETANITRPRNPNPAYFLRPPPCRAAIAACKSNCLSRRNSSTCGSGAAR